MNVLPVTDYKSTISTASPNTITSNAVPSLPDRLRQQKGGAVPLSMTELSNKNKHPLEYHLNNYEKAQESRKLQQYRQIFGIAEPMKRMMDLNIINATDFAPVNSNGNISGNLPHRDILLNKEFTFDWEDVYKDDLEYNNEIGNDIHSKIEKNIGL
ncbi:probable Proteasome maturation factor UMP1 [Saccharomycodes ludwigii]|uniref:Probable Proteasome maturation factor UMP1 n=1 Tax=Saccharomycodes ludwigii TaxID=36035 RepID=A0A376B7K4_9ASCO|nr:hypothetical protein SCDLUD_002058 [Saccharomycodes ludwigii]KAH3902241.1 hypothetical protein SCDLUD_002058 [Saccharomycodes ludwigii]SSD60611.1 probable Proteasome maturation factor UMP1 [Saccharomycodes ludwigii]